MPPQTPKGRLLLVDDDPSVCAVLNDKLTEEGFLCRSCSSGEEALEFLKQEPADLVISDLNMGGISGLELLGEVSRSHPRTAFLMATGESDISIGVEAMKQGAADYLVKPFDLDIVVMSVARALENKRLQLELENYRQHLEEMVEQRTKQLQAAMKRVERTYDETLEALGAALDLRDTETAGHCGRVTRYSLEIAQAFGCSTQELRQIARGSYLHDIGKIGTPDAILLKPGKLDEQERAVMKEHVKIGFKLVSRIAFLADAAEIVLTHQERYDGSGYPLGLKGEKIPLGSRIFAMADTLDAMTSDRPYRGRLPFAEAREEIKRESGRQFDPKVVQVFLSLPESVWEDIRIAVGSSRARISAPRFAAADALRIAAQAAARPIGLPPATRGRWKA